MHRATAGLAEEIRAVRTLSDRLALLHDAYRGERAVIVTCGPSLGDFDPARLRAALAGELTLSVKQAIDVTAEETDFSCFNSFNVTRYRRRSPDTIACLVREPTGRTPQLNKADLVFAQSATSGDLDRSLAATRAFDEHHLDDTTPRPWGPGIMYELVLHLAVHLGVSEIVTIGWDIANAAGRNTHFYDAQLAGDGFDRDRADAFQASTARRALPAVARTSARWARAVVAHNRGTLYNKAVPVEGETECVAASTTDANAWLSDQGVRLRVATNSAYLAPEIDRLTPDEALQLLEAG